MVREPTVSGQFYPQDKEELKRLIEGFAPKVSSKIDARGIILPHAGYIYSGKVAVHVVSRIFPKKRIIILGPNHTGLGENFSLWAKGKWRIPFKDVSIDEELAQEILRKSDCIKEDYLAHSYEHSIEVELPILVYFFEDFKFVPICCQLADIKRYQKVAEQIFEAIKLTKEEILFVASSDMSHYEPEPTARKKDRIALESILNLDEEELIRKVKKENISMCGVSPVSILISCMKKMKADKAEVVLYQTSGQVSGDYSSVVGYAGIVVS
jgi:hypothetical protein